ncbi:flagellar biosynthetic protein FliQ [bacterium]|nr:flagellar biosynthetic protein FliQ [bacterium]
MEVLIEYLAKGFLLMLTISMPCVLVAAGIGLVVGILQAVTQVQEQTIAAAPKILGVFLVIIIGGVGFINLLKGFVNDGMAIAFNLVSKSDSYVLPSNYYKYTSPFANEMSDKINGKSGDVDYLMKHPGKVPYIDHSQKVKYYGAPRNPMPKPDLIETNKILNR